MRTWIVLAMLVVGCGGKKQDRKACEAACDATHRAAQKACGDPLGYTEYDNITDQQRTALLTRRKCATDAVDAATACFEACAKK
jgi:hypothetical protein